MAIVSNAQLIKVGEVEMREIDINKIIVKMNIEVMVCYYNPFKVKSYLKILC